MVVIEVNKHNAVVTLSCQELIILNNSINESREALDAEFSTRMGVEVEEAELLLKQIQDVLAGMEAD